MEYSLVRTIITESMIEKKIQGFCLEFLLILNKLFYIFEQLKDICFKHRLVMKIGKFPFNVWVILLLIEVPLIDKYNRKTGQSLLKQYMFNCSKNIIFKTKE